MTNKPIHKIVEPSAILFIGSDLSQVDENDKVSYTIKQRERLRALTPTVHRNVPLLMVFWTNTGSAQEMAFVHRVTEQCTRDLVWKRCVILSGSESFHEFDRQIDWLMEHSYCIQLYHGMNKFTWYATRLLTSITWIPPTMSQLPANEAQHLLDSVERECQTIIIPLRSLEEPAIKKPRRVIATQSSLNDLRSLVHDVRDWLQQTEPSPPLS
ncbi:hypothetical protein BDF22DRAFT_746782 [Syncephalis plumigaleata]|nr:hypothetical protein BDF22DRAFT_746782 [Syncephalis plumigaleata]